MWNISTIPTFIMANGERFACIFLCIFVQVRLFYMIRCFVTANIKEGKKANFSEWIFIWRALFYYSILGLWRIGTILFSFVSERSNNKNTFTIRKTVFDLFEWNRNGEQRNSYWNAREPHTNPMELNFFLPLVRWRKWKRHRTHKLMQLANISS